MNPTIYKRPNIYNSNVYKRYGVYKVAGVYKLPYGSLQEWTKDNVPAGVQTLHDFGDGLGPVPAIPVDNAGIRDELVKVNAYELHNDNAGIRDEIVEVLEVN